MQHATDMSAEPSTCQCGVTLAALLVIGSSVAARWAAYLPNYEELLPLVQGPKGSFLFFVVMGHRYRKTSLSNREAMRGLCIQPWGF